MAGCTSSQREAACAPTLGFRGVTYLPSGVLPLKRGAPIGKAHTGCVDVVKNGKTDETGGSIEVANVIDVDSRLAVADAGSGPTHVYIAEGRCLGFQDAALVKCLRNTLMYEGRPYVATRLGRRFAVGPRLELGKLAGRDVPVHAASGLSAEKAVLVEREAATLYVEVSACPFSPTEPSFRSKMIKCLRDAS